MDVNPGIWVRQILLKGSIVYGKYTNVALEKWTFQQMLDVWCEVTGKKGVFVPCTLDTFTELFGLAGREYGLQLQYGERCDPWKESGDFIGVKELDIDPNEVVGFRGVMEKLKFLQ
jgi:hypothetical protein